MDRQLTKILIVDDELKILEVVKSFLEDYGFVVFTASNHKEAFEILVREDISLILLDLMLPEMSGEEICVRIRRESRVPIIMITAKADENDVLEGLGIGADDYITKPFSLKTLKARIEAVLRRSLSNSEPLTRKCSYNDRDLEIDLDRRRTTKKTVEVKLTPNEFNVLATLIKYPKKVFTREELISIALGSDFEGYDRTVDTHIKNIRQKIEDNPKEPQYILTIHGVGYRFGGGEANEAKIKD